MNLHKLTDGLRRALVPAALILLLTITLARATRPTAAGQEMSEEVAGANRPADSAPRLVGPRALFQSVVPTPTWTPTPILPTDTPTPILPTDTPTPILPTDTPTPILPTDTPTPIPPTPTPVPGPEVGELRVQPPDGVASIDTEISFIAVFTDPTVFNGSAVWDWGDGLSTTQDPVTSPAQASHAYAEAGIYAVKVTVTNNSTGLSDSGVFEFIIVYDPSGGFVTGGGWIDSPAGAYVDDASLTGKATFAFVSKYTKGRQVPSGNTQFRFKVANLNFSSDHYTWLVVTGDDRAIFSGKGTVNDLLAPQGQLYKFKIFATDGEPDTFRIRIWWELADGTEIDFYDNGMDQPIGGGSIVVHKGKGK